MDDFNLKLFLRYDIFMTLKAINKSIESCDLFIGPEVKICRILFKDRKNIRCDIDITRCGNLYEVAHTVLDKLERWEYSNVKVTN